MPENDSHTNDNNSLTSPGDIFKRCREFHNLSLDDAAESTKISVEYLQALEENRISQFASLAYLKGFVRIYANTLGLNPDDIIRLYEKMYSKTGNYGSSSNTSRSGRKKNKFHIPFQKLLIPAILLVLILITSTFMNHTDNPAPPPQPAKTAAIAPVSSIQAPISSSRPPLQATVQHQPNNEQQAKENEAPQKDSAAAPAESEHKGFIVSLKIIRNSSLTVTVDSTEPQSHDMTTGDRIEWRGNNQIILDLSDAGAAEGSINGKPLPSFGGEGIHKIVTLREDGVK